MGFKNFKGVSIVEIVVSFAVLAILSIIIGSVYLAHFRIFSNQNTSMDIATQARQAIDEMTMQIQQAESIVAGCASCGVDTSDATTLIIRLWSIDASGEPIDPGGTTYDYIVFKRDPAQNKILKVTYPSGSSTRPGGVHIVAGGATALSFTYDNATPANATEVEISTTSTANSISRTQSTTEVGKASLRNK